jgi:hypothetical protein
MKQRKIAISLAIVGAIAAPFAFKTWKVRPTSEVSVPLTADEKQRISGYLEKTKNCETLMGQPGEDRLNVFARTYICERDRESLQRGAEVNEYPSLPKYLAINLAAAIAAFVGVFGLTFLIPAIVRRYWLWLNT